ncbi:MAG: hypothetical protein A4E48_01334 [Methanosaeta sp. PtaU1.Bin060]|nr:MAG: hypothetical protein A4E48_01334 [Methanosaeta sp. PtaU1.Bin060]
MVIDVYGCGHTTFQNFILNDYSINFDSLPVHYIAKKTNRMDHIVPDGFLLEDGVMVSKIRAFFY